MHQGVRNTEGKSDSIQESKTYGEREIRGRPSQRYPKMVLTRIPKPSGVHGYRPSPPNYRSSRQNAEQWKYDAADWIEMRYRIQGEAPREKCRRIALSVRHPRMRHLMNNHAEYQDYKCENILNHSKYSVLESVPPSERIPVPNDKNPSINCYLIRCLDTTTFVAYRIKQWPLSTGSKSAIIPFKEVRRSSGWVPSASYVHHFETTSR